MGHCCVTGTVSAPEGGGLVPEAFLGTMRGGSGSVLVQASDGHCYVIKSTENCQGQNVPFNEALGSLLASNLGIPVPVWAPVTVGAHFIEQNWIPWSLEGRRLPQPGVYFGSRFLDSSRERSVYQMIPDNWVRFISNPASFIGMLVLDIWAENLDRRQALFVQPRGSRWLNPVFIDQGHFFGGPQGGQRLTADWACLYHERGVYGGQLTKKALGPWLRRVDEVSARTLDEMIDTIPEAWKRGIDTKALIHRLNCRRASLYDRATWAWKMVTRKLA